MRASRENELKDAAQRQHRLRPHDAGLPARAWQPDKVRAEHACLCHALAVVIRERDLAVKEKHQLQAKLENLEQVLKHMREAAERRQQLELEHEQALAVLHAKQQEIDLLQKAQVEAKKEHEGAVRLLENTLDGMQSKVRELEEKCRTQSEQFSLLSQDLERLRQHAGKIDLLGGSAGTSLDVPSKGKCPPLPPRRGVGVPCDGTFSSHAPTPLPPNHPQGHTPRPSTLALSAWRVPRRGSGKGPPQVHSWALDLLLPKACRTPDSAVGADTYELDANKQHALLSSPSTSNASLTVSVSLPGLIYNPFDGPNENPEAELPLTAGKYLYVYGDMDEDGFYEGELLDGQRGLVPSNFVDFVQDNESRLGTEQDQNLINHASIGLEGENILDLHAPTHIDAGVTDNGAGTLGVNIDEIGEDIVPYPRKITLIKQLARSVIVAWEPPAVPPGWGTVSSYNVLVDQETRVSLMLGSRTKALIEKLNTAACTYRISVQCITSRGSSDELQCTLLVGKDVVVAPSHLRVDNITQISAQLSWLPTNSNYSHVIFLNEEELDVVKAARYKYQFLNLRPNMAYKVKVLAKPHQMPWQLPLEQREKKEAFVEFSTLPAGPPAPPQDVTVHAGATPATIQVSWKPPALTTSGLSNGANVSGYGVYAKGQRVAEVISPVADSIAVEIVRLRSLEAKAVTVRTLSAQGESMDSAPAAIPPDLLVPPTPHPRTAPTPKPLASAGAPDTKDEHLGPHVAMDGAWEQGGVPAPAHGHMLEPPSLQGSGPGRRSPSPSRILPQPQGTPVSTSVAKAMAREAAQRVAESSRDAAAPPEALIPPGGVPRAGWSQARECCPHASSLFGSTLREAPGLSVQQMGRPGESGSVRTSGREDTADSGTHGSSILLESSRGSDLSDIMEEDEEELYSEMQLEDGGRRRPSGTSHNALKKNPCWGAPEECSQSSGSEGAFLEPPEHPHLTQHSSRLFSIPEVAEEGEHLEVLHKQGLGYSARARAPPASRLPAKPRGPGGGPHAEDFALEDRGCWSSRAASRSPMNPRGRSRPPPAPSRVFSDCGHRLAEGRTRSEGPELGRAGLEPLSLWFQDLGFGSGSRREECLPRSPFSPPLPSVCRETALKRFQNVFAQDHGTWDISAEKLAFRGSVRAWERGRGEPGRAPVRERAQRSLTQGRGPAQGRPDTGTQLTFRGQSPFTSTNRERERDRGRQWMSRRGRGTGRLRKSISRVVDFYEESETDPGAEELPARIFVALFDYDPLTMSPNPDAAEEELPFKEGQIIKVYGDKDADGFYRGETCARLGLIPCNMVSEIQADDEEMMDQLLRQGFLPLNTPVEKIGGGSVGSWTHSAGRPPPPESSPRGMELPCVPTAARVLTAPSPHAGATRRVVALYDYDPRESSPNIDVEAELTFCTGDIITVFGEIDEDGFYYGELNGQKGLVPSNFLE
uniref:RIMS-binding protein 2 n=1 Tax=Mustela putorius furo TaxID=9669 RepID=M3XYB1_MUSPF